MNVELAVKGLAVLTAIPIVMIAIWMDYFSRGLEALAKENPEYDRSIELFKLRLGGVIGIIFQFGIFMGTSPIREEAPLAANGLFVGSILIQAILQTQIEKKVEPPKSLKGASEPTPPIKILNATRAFFWATLAGALYIGGLIFPVAIASNATRLMHASPATSSVTVIIAAIVGMLVGLGLNFALGAFYLRKMVPTVPVEEAGPLKMLEDCFEQAGLRSPSFWIVDTGQAREATAMVAGFQGGRGWFKPGLFLSKTLVETLSEEELRAVVLHEVSHLKLHHLRKRLLLAAGLIVSTTTVATFFVFLASVFLPDNDLRSFIGFAAAAGAFLLTFKVLGRQSRVHETEADTFAIGKLGADLARFASALRKLDGVNRVALQRPNPLTSLTGPGHPATELRIAYLNLRFGSTQETLGTTADSKSEDRAA